MGWSNSKGWNNNQGWSQAVITSGGITWNPNSTQPAAQNAGFGTSATFSVTLDSTPAASDIIVVGVMNSAGPTAPLTSVTVNGAGASPVSGRDPTTFNESCALIYQITGITTPSLSIVLNTGGGLYGCAVAVGVIKNATSSTSTAQGSNAQDNQADPQDLSGGTGAITVPSAGVGVFHFAVSRTGTPSSTSSTIVAAASVTDSTSDWFSTMGYTTTPGSWDPDVSGSPPFNFAGGSTAAAAWH